MKLVFPPGVTSYNDENGNVWTPDANDEVTLSSTTDLTGFFNAGFTQPVESFGATRPANTYPGQGFFDVTVNGGAGGPIWRNASNTAWTNGVGTVV